MTESCTHADIICSVGFDIIQAIGWRMITLHELQLLVTGQDNQVLKPTIDDVHLQSCNKYMYRHTHPVDITYMYTHSHVHTKSVTHVTIDTLE